MKLLIGLLACFLSALPLWAQTRERAALLPVSFLGLPAVQANFLFNRLQDQLSREFALVSQAEVAQAYEDALTTLSGAACTEENCIAAVQASLRVQVVLSLQVLREEASGLVQVTLTLQEGDRRQVRTRNCEACQLEALLQELEAATESLLLVYQQEQRQRKVPAGLRWKPEALTLREGKGPTLLQVGVTSVVQQSVTLQLSSPDPRVQIDPTTVVVDPGNWSDWQAVSVQVPDDLRLQGRQTAQLTLAPSPETQEVDYGFVAPVEVALTLEDDDRVGGLEVLSTPPGAAIWEQGHPLVDGQGAPRLTPAKLELPAGATELELRLPGYRPQTVPVDVTHTRMGVRSIRLEPLPGRLKVVVHPDNRAGTLVVNGTRRLPLQGQTEATFEAPAGTYRLQLEDGPEASPVQTLTLKAGAEETLRVSRVGPAPVRRPDPPRLQPPPEPAVRWVLGLSANAYRVTPDRFPTSHVSIEHPVHATLEGQARWGSLEGFYGQAAQVQVTRPIWLGTASASEAVTGVTWSRWGVRYWTPRWHFLRATLGVAQQVWEFATASSRYRGVQTVTEVGAGIPFHGKRWQVEPRLVGDGSTWEANLALGVRF